MNHITSQNFHRPGLVELTLDNCIKCNICTSACPISAVTDLFPGPKYVGPQAGRFRNPHNNSVDKSVDYCSGCRVCNMVCPTGVKIAEMNARARAVMVKYGKIPFRRRLRNNLVARSELFGKIAQPIAPLTNPLISFAPLRRIVEGILGISRHAPFPKLATKRFTSWYRSHHCPPSHRKVVIFHGCSTEYFEPRVGRAAVGILEMNGFEVIVPKQNCCGLPLLSNGEFEAARRYHRNNVKSLVEYAREGIPIVGTSTSCILTLKEEAPELLDMDDEDSKLVARQTYDLAEFLLLLNDQGKLETNLHPIPMTLPYHIPCQYRAHRIGKPGLELLELIPDLNILQSNVACCGIAGTYGYKSEKYTIARQVGKPLFDFVDKIGGPFVLCESETCRWQISHATGVPAYHPVELLAAAYGLEVDGKLAEAIIGA